VKSRLETSQGISFTEFSYQLLQAHDFFYLYMNHGCRLQVGGADQWGNIVAGTDLIKRRHTSQEEQNQSEPAYGLTVPLLTTPSGEKFGKSAGNAIWLDSKMTSVLDFYQVGLYTCMTDDMVPYEPQYFIRQPDDAVANLLRIFTFLPLSQIELVMTTHEVRINPWALPIVC
jgi:tyrosyl-tRNA synthetase